MKNILLYFILVTFFSCSNVNEAIQYNDKIVDIYSSMAVSEARLLYTVLSVDTALVKLHHENLLLVLDNAQTELLRIGPFKEYDDFVNASSNLIEAYKYMANNEMIDLIEFVELHLFEINQNDSLDMLIDSLLLNLDSRIEPAFIEFEMAQQKFAVRHAFELEN